MKLQCHHVNLLIIWGAALIGAIIALLMLR